MAAAWSLEGACAALRAADIAVAPAEVTLEARDGRCLMRLAEDRLAWFADGERGRELMARERRVLRLLAARCKFAVPRVIFEADDGAFDVRAAVPGLVDPWGVLARMKVDRAMAVRMGTEIGAWLAEQHTRVAAADVAGWLPSSVLWPEPTGWIRQRLPRVVADLALYARIDAMLSRYDATIVAEEERALVPGDVGFHNLALDPATWAVRGIFDYEGAAWADRHHDFRYLFFAEGHDEMLEAALAAYEPVAGRTLSRTRIRLYNAAAAASFLALRDGVPPEERS